MPKINLDPIDPLDLPPEFPRRAFSTTVPLLQKVWDSTSMTTLMACPRRYELKILRGISKPDDKVYLQWGIAFHSALEAYDRALASGAPPHEAEHRALAWLFDHLPTEVTSTDLRNRDHVSLIRALVWYFDQYRGDTFGSTFILKNGKPAVELAFRFQLPIQSPDGDPFLSSGYIDRVIQKSDGTLVLADYKATKSSLSDSYFEQFDLGYQVTNYLMAGRVVLGVESEWLLIDAVQTGVNFTRFGRHLSRRTPRQFDAWLRDLAQWIELAHQFAVANYWPQNTTACWNCEFKPICKRDPSTASFALSNYDPEPQFWDPTANRGDS